MSQGPLGRVRLWYASTGSTNDVTARLAGVDFPAGTVVVADQQTAGRGRLGRRWVAPAGSALLCSLLLRPALAVSQANRLTMAAALAAAEAITSTTGLRAGLKWPNDVLLPAGFDWRKVAGILVETTLSGDRLATAIIGIGINLTAHPPELVMAGDLAELTGRVVDRQSLLAALLVAVERRLAQLANDSQGLFGDWQAALVMLGRPIRLNLPSGPTSVIAERVMPDGRLLVCYDDGRRQLIDAGDVSLLSVVGAPRPPT